MSKPQGRVWVSLEHSEAIWNPWVHRTWTRGAIWVLNADNKEGLMIRLHCQLDWTEKDLGHQQSTPLDVSTRMFPEMVHQGRKT